ncbi:MAG: flagellar biosynthesis protein FlhB [Alphaproteobacteria bacterium]|nr:flagellar biosynthesis protein FlhB [Alphaproteobacteria bacterium]
MADNEDSTDDSQKTEEPTARKLEEARKRGQIVFSREVMNWVMLFTGTVILGMAGPSLMGDLTALLRNILSTVAQYPADRTSIGHIMTALLLKVMGILAFPFLVLMVVPIIVGFLQTGGVFTTEPIKPDLSKISLIQGFTRLFSQRSIVEFVKGIFKLVIVSAAGFMVLKPYFAGVEHFVGQDVHAAMFDLHDLFVRMMTAALSVLFFMAVGDYIFQRHDFMKKMMMSKQELKEEFKQTEGDPQVKGRLRQLREQRARQRMMQAVPLADVVITNPTHYAVALKYDGKEMPAPQMVAKGADLVAQRIRELAAENEVPLVENAPLARALYDSMEIEQMIPQEHYKAVAEVISYVFRLKGKTPS